MVNRPTVLSKLVRVRLAIFSTAFLACCRATAGLCRRRWSSTGMDRSAASPSFSGMVRSASQASALVKGMNSRVTTTLNRVWKLAMSPLVITSFQKGKRPAALRP